MILIPADRALNAFLPRHVRFETERLRRELHVRAMAAYITGTRRLETRRLLPSHPLRDFTYNLNHAQLLPAGEIERLPARLFILIKHHQSASRVCRKQIITRLLSIAKNHRRFAAHDALDQ